MGPRLVRSCPVVLVALTTAGRAAADAPPPSPPQAPVGSLVAPTPDEVAEFCRLHPANCEAPGPPPPRVNYRRAPNPLPADQGLELGFAVGVAHPGGMMGEGSIATTPYVSDLAEATVPFRLDGGYRLYPALYLGGTLVFAPAFGDDSSYCAACTLRYDFQVTANVRLYPFPRSTVSPWVSYGAGWEVLHVNFAGSADGVYQGPIAADLQIGLDLRKGGFAIGPYFGLALAEFDVRSLSPSPPGEPSPSAAFHEWFTLGIHASYGP